MQNIFRFYLAKSGKKLYNNKLMKTCANIRAGFPILLLEAGDDIPFGEADRPIHLSTLKRKGMYIL